MKYLIFIAVCVFLVVEATAPPPPPPPRGTRPPPPPRGTRPPRPTRRTRLPPPPSCDSGDDCAADECCVRNRIPFKKGMCLKHITEGRRCSSDEPHFQGKYIFKCPCAEGLTCEARKEVETKHGKILVNERCVKPGSTAEPEEETGEPGSKESQESDESEE